MRIHTFLLLSLMTAAAGADEPEVCDPGLTVATTTGPVCGVTAGGLHQWRGIPYAAAPVGNLRWRAPADVTPWTDVRDGSQFGSPCAQPSWGPDGNLELYGQEDCLFLNVSVPTQPPGGPMGVMVDLHGGGNVFGEAMREGESFTRHGIIVVTLNYRLGIFGFLGHPALSAEDGGSSSNYAILDQIQALRWVQANIARFGGDPTRVSLSGFSAGAGDVITLVASPLARGLFSRAIASSFDRINVHAFPWNSLAQREQDGLAVAAQLGCTDLNCLRMTKSTDELLRASPYYDNMAAAVGGSVLPRPALELIATHSSVPLLIGDGREEAGWAAFDAITPDPLPTNMYNIVMMDLFGARHHAEGIKIYNSDSATPWLAYVRAQTDVNTVCPTRRVALATRAPTYRYLWTHVLRDPNFPAQVLAAHGSDIPLLWHLPWYPFADHPEEEALSFEMSRYHANFVKSGNPNDASSPVTWPRFDDSEAYLEMGDTFTPHATGYHIPHCELSDSIPVSEQCQVLCRWFSARNMPAVLRKMLGL